MPFASSRTAVVVCFASGWYRRWTRLGAGAGASVLLMPFIRYSSNFHRDLSSISGSGEIAEELRSVMRKVPSPVVVVTTSHPNDTTNMRGTTVSSFTSVSLHPPIVSFCLRTPSRTSDLLHESNLFAVHVLARHQVMQSVTFSSPVTQTHFDQFPHHWVDVPDFPKEATAASGATIGSLVEDEVASDTPPHRLLPVLMGCLGVMLCRTERVLTIGDHEVWYGTVFRIVHGVGGIKKRRGSYTSQNQLTNAERGKKADDQSPLVYYQGGYVSVGDEVFIQAFENMTLSFSQWTHRAHIRMAWIYLNELGNKEAAFPIVKEGIERYNTANAEHIVHGYNETITSFFLHLIDLAVHADRHNRLIQQKLSKIQSKNEGNREVAGEVAAEEPGDDDFLEFLDRYPFLEDGRLIGLYYSKGRIMSNEAKISWIEPDLRPLPQNMTDLMADISHLSLRREGS
ncbi:flavin reductase like domain-containing protein [Cladochytrium replicatum]|nr:flavin reductase like domain-containing protein [Cladochytrium replicatum]